MAKKTLDLQIHKSKILNSNRKLHHMAHGNIVRHLRTLAKDTGLEMLSENPEVFDFFKVTVTVYPPTRRRLDPANLWPTVKALIDGLTDANWWEDDDFKHLLEIGFRYGGLSGEKEVFRMKLDIEEIDSENLGEYQLEAELAEDN